MILIIITAFIALLVTTVISPVLAVLVALGAFMGFAGVALQALRESGSASQVTSIMLLKTAMSYETMPSRANMGRLSGYLTMDWLVFRPLFAVMGAIFAVVFHLYAVAGFAVYGLIMAFVSKKYREGKLLDRTATHCLEMFLDLCSAPKRLAILSVDFIEGIIDRVLPSTAAPVPAAA